MKHFMLIGCLVLASVFLISHSAPVDDELNEYNESLEAAKKTILEAKQTLKSDYVQNFASIMYTGVEELDKSTRANLAKTTDKAERTKLIEYGTKAFKRLVVFLIEIKNSLE